MALLLLRHALTLTDEDDDDTSAVFSLFLLRAAGFLLPFYIMAWAISILQRRRQRQVQYAISNMNICIFFFFLRYFEHLETHSPPYSKYIEVELTL